MSQNIFYNYVLLDHTKPGVYEYGQDLIFEFEPFYVGKGKGGRCYNHFTPAALRGNSNKASRIREIKRITGEWPVIVVINEDIDEWIAFSYEYEIISSIGRKDRKQGPLLNRCSGGAGTSGRKDSPEVCARRGKAISAAIVRMPESVLRDKAARAAATWASWSDERYDAFIEKCKESNVSHEIATRKKMSTSGKLRVQTESQEVKDKRGEALSRSHRITWANYSEGERAARSQSLVNAHANQSTQQKSRTSMKISASVKAVHATRSEVEEDIIRTKIALTLMLKHKSITDRLRKTIWSMYNGYDFTTYYSTDLMEDVLNMVYEETGRMPNNSIPELSYLKSVGKFTPEQVAQQRSVNRKLKLSSMSPEEVNKARSRTSLTLLLKTPAIAECRHYLERLFTNTDFSDTT